MRVIAVLFFTLVIAVGVYYTYPSNNQTAEEDTDTLCVSDSNVIEMMCKEAWRDTLSDEEAVYWDSMNAAGGYMLVRGAERNLDTIVNHLRMVFITDL